MTRRRKTALLSVLLVHALLIAARAASADDPSARAQQGSVPDLRRDRLRADIAKRVPAQTDATADLIKRLGLEEASAPVRERPGWAPPRKVLVWNRAPQLIPALQSVAPGVELLAAANEAEAVKLAPQADAVIGFCSQDVLAAGPRVQWVQVFWAGVEDCVSVPALRERGVLLT